MDRTQESINLQREMIVDSKLSPIAWIEKYSERFRALIDPPKTIETKRWEDIRNNYE